MNVEEELNVVYTMGKVASTSISASLTQACIQNHQVHVLSKPKMLFLLRKLLEDNEFPPNHLGRSIAIHRRFQRLKKIKIVTCIREPISHCISGVFQNLNRSCADVEKIKSLVVNKPLDAIDQWFEDEFFKTTNVDIYSHKFDIDKKFSIINEGRFEILILRVDLDDVSKEEILSDFFAKPVVLNNSNISSKKWYADMKKEFHENIHLPFEWVISKLETKGSRHFFSADEIESIKKRYCNV